MTKKGILRVAYLLTRPLSHVRDGLGLSKSRANRRNQSQLLSWQTLNIDTELQGFRHIDTDPHTYNPRTPIWPCFLERLRGGGGGGGVRAQMNLPKAVHDMQGENFESSWSFTHTHTDTDTYTHTDTADTGNQQVIIISSYHHIKRTVYIYCPPSLST
jgi:hypothetical protein